MKIGNAECAMREANITSVVCEVPFMTAGFRAVSISVDGLGLATNTSVSAALSFTHMLLLSSISPSMGSIAGGTRVTVAGHGLSLSTAVRFSSVAIVATPVSLSPDFTKLVVLTPPAGGSVFPVNRTVSVSVLGETDILDRCGGMSLASRPQFSSSFVNCSSPDACTFGFHDSLAYSPQLTAVPSPAVGFQGTVIVLRGFGFGNYSARSLVDIGGAECVPVNTTSSAWNDNFIVCVVGETPAGDHVVNVTIDGKGGARHMTGGAGGIQFKSLLELNSVSLLLPSLFELIVLSLR